MEERVVHYRGTRFCWWWERRRDYDLEYLNVKFGMSIRHPSGYIWKVSGYKSLELGREVDNRYTCWLV